jgi:hypothetical protein
MALSVSKSSVTDVACKGGTTGSITVSGSGGTPTYSYNIGGGTYGSSATFTGLSAGTYTIGIKDSKGCTSSVSVSVSEPSTALSVSTTSVTHVDCYGNATGSITVSGAGGTSSYQYNIGGGSYSSVATFSTLKSGTYTVGVQDSKGCTSTVSVTINQPSSALSASTTATNVSCYGLADGSIATNAFLNSPSGLAIDSKGYIKLTDFGLSKIG